jgi:N-acetylneuraminic acid mutarotase
MWTNWDRNIISFPFLPITKNQKLFSFRQLICNAMKKFTLVGIAWLLIVPAPATYAQYTWTQKASFSGTARYSAVSFSLGGKGYVGTGWDGTLRRDFWEYDPILDSWTQVADYGGANCYGAIAFISGSLAYVTSGRIAYPGTGFSSALWEYNSLTNTWTQKSAFPGTSRYTATGFCIGNTGYLLSGYNGNRLGDVWAYDIQGDSWSQKTSFSGTARQSAAAASLNGTGYVGTGHDGSERQDFWSYDPVMDSWTQKADFGGQPRHGAVAFDLSGFIFMGLGCNASTIFHDLWQYDPSQNSWTQSASYPGSPAQSVSASVCTIGTHAYLGLGSDINTTLGTYTSDWWEFGPLSTGIALVQEEEPVCQVSTLFSEETDLHLLLQGTSTWMVFDCTGRLIDEGRGGTGIRQIGKFWKPGAYIIQVIHGSRKSCSRLVKIT